MTDEEIRELIDQRIKEISLGIKAEGSAKGMTPTLSKWFRDDDGHVNMSKMHKALQPNSTVTTYSVWDHVRRIATIMCHADNVRAIKDYDKANYYADAICQKIYDLMMKDGFTKCSECGYRPRISSGWNFCQNCGADMREGEEG